MKITKGLLSRLPACESAMDLICESEILPVVLHKDPEKNNDIAIKLINIYTFSDISIENVAWISFPYPRSLMRDLDWLLFKLSRSPRNSLFQSSNMILLDFGENCDLDPLVIAQVLSWIADTKP